MKSMKGAVAVISTLLMMVGCAAPTDDDEAADESTGAVGTEEAPLVKGAAAVEVIAEGGRSNGSATLAAPRKLNAIVRSLKRRTGAARPEAACTAAERDRYRTLTLRFLDASGTPIATADLTCTGDGKLKANGRSTAVTAAPELRSAIDAPVAVGDALWGITEVTIHDILNRHPKVVVAKSSDLAEIMKAFAVEQSLRPKPATERVCAPSYLLEFRRGDRSVADSAFVCLDESSGAMAIEATFVARAPSGKVTDPPTANGRISVDARRVLALVPRR